MDSIRKGSVHLFRFAGVDVFLHWSWFLVALFEINARSGRYSSVAWNAAEYLALFAVVLLHEYGHALACRQVGGNADHIVLWPLGGVAYVDPPPRPGATLWSIAAGPLVNVVLIGVFGPIYLWMSSAGTSQVMPNAYALALVAMKINFGLLVFNLLPIYPLDGGQILRSLLVVCPGTRPQPDGRHRRRLYRRAGPHLFRRIYPLRLVCHFVGVHPHELLGRT